MHDILILGAGPAGLSAAVAARQKNRSVLVISNPSASARPGGAGGQLSGDAGADRSPDALGV